MKKIILSVLVALEVIMIGTVYSDNITNEISDELLRLHILANSDSETDQKVKIEVRDFILSYIDKEKLNSKQNVIDSIKEMEIAVNDFLIKQNQDYNCKIEFSNTIFKTKTYCDLSIPTGKYESLKVILGNGKGKNWWCVAYPPLCFTESVVGNIRGEGNEKLHSLLHNETYNLITNKSVKYRIKFKSVEILNSILNSIDKENIIVYN